MTAAQLETLADQLIDGEITVEAAEAICSAAQRSEPRAELVAYPAPPASGGERPLNETVDEEQEARDNADRYYATVAAASSAWPLVSFEPGDAEFGYQPDPTWIKSESALEREYAKPYYREVVDFERTPDGYIVLDESGARIERRESVLTMGSVEWEYHRRSQGRQPWMPAATYRFVMDQERRRQRMHQQRSAVIRLIRELGQDPKRPEIVEWVQRVGYERALDALSVRAGRPVAA